MAAQAALAAKTVITVVGTNTGTAYSMSPRGRDAKGVLKWVYPGATTLDDVIVDLSYRPPTATRKSTKATARVISPKTYTDTTTGLIAKAGENIAELNFSFVENATVAEKVKVLDILLSMVGLAEFRLALSTGDVMY